MTKGSIEFDLKHNCVYWAETSTIGKKFTSQLNKKNIFLFVNDEQILFEFTY